MIILYTIALVAWLPLVALGGTAAPPPPPPPPQPKAQPQSSMVAPYMGGPMGMMGGGCVGPGCGPGFNPVLLGGMRGYPGIRARLNSRMFQYASQLVGELLNKQIQRARLPDMFQSTQPMADGCIVLYNAYVSRYRCPQRVVVFPKAPNKIVMQVQNMDVGITGNLGGEIRVIIPIALSGIAQINIHGLTIAVEAAIEQGPHGPRISICSCAASVDFVDICIENGGLVGSIANSFFRRSISNMVKDMLPGELCKRIPQQVNEQLNSRAGAIPQAVALTQLAALAGGGLSSSPPRPDPQFCEQQCGVKMSALASSGAAAVAAPQIPTSAYGGANGTRFLAQRSILPPHLPAQRIDKPLQVYRVYNTHRRVVARAAAAKNARLPVALAARAADPRQQPQRQFLQQVAPNQQQQPRQLQQSRVVDHVTRHKRAAERVLPRGATQNIVRTNAVVLPSRNIRRSVPAAKIVRTRGAAPSSALAVKPPPAQHNPAMSYMCSQCSMSADDPSGFIRDLAKNLDLSKLSDMFLSVQLMNTYATSNDFTVDLTGEFSPGGQGGTPFGPFPTMFPAPYDNHMAEAIVSDYTLNSLFYWMHKKGFMTFRIGPETPKIGELLKTTCDEGEDDLEGTPVETDEAGRKKKLKRRHLRHLLQARHKRAVVYTGKPARQRRQETTTADALGGLGGGDSGSLSDLGICFGDILPAVREKYPNEKIFIQVHTIRAPSILLSRMKGGSASIDLCADADIYIEGKGIKVGTITVVAQIDINLQLKGNKLFGMGEITTLKLTDAAMTLGLPQDALDNLGTLGKELITKLANDALMKGIPINLTQSPNLPITFYNPTVMIIDHGLYVAGDITIAPALLGTLGGSGSCYRY